MGFVSNSPEYDAGTESLAQDVAVYVLPAWVHKAFTSRYNLADMLDYEKLRAVLPLEDVAHLEILRTQIFKNSGMHDIEYIDGAVRSFIHWNWNDGQMSKPMTPHNWAEVKSSVNLLVNTPSVVAEALGRLKVNKSGTTCEAVEAGYTSTSAETAANKMPCRVVTLNSALYIIVEEGFLSYIEGSAGRLAFLTLVLKAAYAVFPVRMVNSSLWYRSYIRALAA